MPQRKKRTTTAARTKIAKKKPAKKVYSGCKKLRSFLHGFKVSYADFGKPLDVTRTSVLRWCTDGRPDLPRARQIERLTCGHVKVSDYYASKELAAMEVKGVWKANSSSLIEGTADPSVVEAIRAGASPEIPGA